MRGPHLNRTGDIMAQDNEQDRTDVTEEPRTEGEQQDEQDVQCEAEELEERIAPAKAW